MCYDDLAQPPLPPGATGAARGEELVLTASDGNRLMGYLALPEKPSGAQVLVLPDIRGLHSFYKELALRFAEIGIAALAMDYFGRTAGLSSRAEGFECMPHVQQMTPATFVEDARASLAALHEQAGAGASFTLGFCLGGTLSFYCGTQGLGLAGAIGFYSGMRTELEGQTILERAPAMQVPALGLFGGADQGIPVEQVEQFDRALDTAGVDHKIVIYPGAPHSFFDRQAEEFAEASADAWAQVLAFIRAHSAS